MMTARQLALDVISASRERRGFVGDLLDDRLATSDLSPQDRRFVTQLVFGVSRRPLTLDILLTPFVQRPLNKVEPVLLDILRLGAYQITFLTQIPPHAAVHETVELALAVEKPGAKGFLNGILRRITELVTSEYIKRPRADAVPVEGGQFRRLTQPIFPDPRELPDGYLVEAYSWPLWLAHRWLDRFGVDECYRLADWFQTPPPVWLRVNEHRVEREDYRIHLASLNIDADPGTHPASLLLQDSIPLRELPGYADGDFAVQDHASMLVASALNPQPGNRVLDLCAAPGGKTTHMAELMQNKGEITACDIDAERLQTVESLAARLGHTIIKTQVFTDVSEAPAGPFDAVLADVPCSNTGVLGRRPEVRQRLQPNEFQHLIRLQTQILKVAIDRVKPKGAVVYSTCSIEPDENQEVVRAILRLTPGLKVEADHTSIPGQPSDGGFWARLRKAPV
ncbi:MAG: 16S rRNA (cytosine(967)-C(5))-methyltransferase RsmB [Fimbriiglobus sp.]